MVCKKVLITGATGLVGRKLCDSLIDKGWQLKILGRSPELKFRNSFALSCKYYQWADPAMNPPPTEALDVDSAIHLMGEPLANGRWNEPRKKHFITSRVNSTRLLVDALKHHSPNLESFISASAIGIYGDQRSSDLDEQSLPAQDFLGQLCTDWEHESRQSHTRSIQIRIGLVLAKEGGALAKMNPIFKYGFGGRMGDGKHWMSWIHIEDLVNIFVKAIEDKNLTGPINGVSPQPVTNSDFTKSLAKSLKVSAFLPAPSFALKMATGELASLLLSSQKVHPRVLIENDFSFRFADLDTALASLTN